MAASERFHSVLPKAHEGAIDDDEEELQSLMRGLNSGAHYS